jgi:pimeloyl-ACP methyl ester carboxylesterase
LFRRLPLALAIAAVAGLAAFAEDAPAAKTGLQQEVTFTDYSPLAGNTELMRRLLSPLALEMVHRNLAKSGNALPEQSIDLAKERFVLYVPPTAPPNGYALLVFVPPWPEAKLPQGWASIFDRNGVIFVSAARSGNEDNTLGRREPLAVLAAHNVMRRYPVDPRRVYVGGFSGGSRIALRLALGYPDLFHGALLNAGSDPLGVGPPPLPPKDLFQQFQASSRLVYVTGADDLDTLALDATSTRSMHRWCADNLDAKVTPGAGHDLVGGEAFSQALRSLDVPAAGDAAKLAACRSGMDDDMARQLKEVEALIAAGKRSDARSRLVKIDAGYGAYAAPRSLELAKTCGCGL